MQRKYYITQYLAIPFNNRMILKLLYFVRTLFNIDNNSMNNAFFIRKQYKVLVHCSIQICRYNNMSN